MRSTRTAKTGSDRAVLIYLDSSAIVKLVRREPETRALIACLSEHPDRVTSVVAAVEVRRAVRRTSRSPRALDRADRVLARIGLVELNASICACAAGLQPLGLRTLDAIHIATALDVADGAAAIITYDDRQADAARSSDMEVFSPGR